MLATSPTTAARPSEPLERVLVTTCGGLSALLALACGIALCLRRAAGGFDPLGGGGLIVAAALGGLLVAACDATARFVRLRPAWPVVARAGYLLALAALALPPRLVGGGAVAFFLAAVIAAWIVSAPYVGREAPRWMAGLRARAVAWSRSAEPRVEPAAERLVHQTAPCPGHLRQRFERYELDGFDCLHGTLALTVARGARSAQGHIGFCPAFRRVPEVQTQTAFDGVEAVVTAAEVVPWGARIECRLDEPVEEAVEIPIDVFARSPA